MDGDPSVIDFDQLENEAVLITGADGIGLALAETFAAGKGGFQVLEQLVGEELQ